MRRSAPLVSVLLPVRDALPYLRSSLDSLWRQSLADFEVVAVDDGSTDGSGEALERAAADEPRLRVLHTSPRGVPRALNRALAHARGRFIARHDADDLSHRDRLRLQVEHLVGSVGTDVLGCRMRLFPAAEVGAGMRRYARWHNTLLRHEEMAHERWVESPLAHATAMMRREVLERAGGWRERGWPEDLDLWMRLFARGARFAKLERTLYAWRQHPASATRRNPAFSPGRFLALRLHYLGRDFLARRPGPVALIGTGRSGARWGSSLRAQGATVVYVEARSPQALFGRGGTARAGPGSTPGPPLVLVFGAAPARARWREALRAQGLSELQDFVFVA